MKRLAIASLLFVIAVLASIAARLNILSPVSAIDGGPIINLSTVILLVVYMMVLREPRTLVVIASGYFLAGILTIQGHCAPGAAHVFLETLEPLFILLITKRYWSAQQDKNAPRLLLFYSLTAVLVTAAFATLVMAPHLLRLKSELDPALDISAMWLFSHLAAYLAVAPFMLGLVLDKRSVLLKEAQQNILRGGYYLAIMVGLLLFALFAPHLPINPLLKAAAPWSLILLAPAAIYAAYRVGFIITGVLTAVGVLLLAYLTAMQPGSMNGIRPNNLRLFLAISGLSVMVLLGFVRLLANALREAEQAIASKDRFLAMMGHELRSSLTGVVGAAAILRDELLEGADKNDRLGLIQRNGELMSRLIEDAVDYSREGDKGIELNPVNFSLADAARDSAEMFRERLSNKGVEMIVDVGDLDELPLQADRSRIQQVMINLLSNAAKFTDKGAVSIALRAKPLNSDLVACEIEVSDTGPGVPQSERRRIFEVFSGSDPEQGGGLGLGLAISRDIAHAMDGSITVFDNDPKGAVFRFKFVARRKPTTDDEERTKPVLETPGEYSVLIAEDNQASRVILEAMLQAAGLNVTSVENGEEALEAVRNIKFDLIMLDMHMPKMNGATAVREIRAHESDGPYTPILIVSGDDDPKKYDELVELGAAHIVAKPYTAERLIEAVGLALQQREGVTAISIDPEKPSA